MYVCLNGSLVGGRIRWPEFAHFAARMGFPGTEVNLRRAMDEGLDSSRALFAELKLKPAVVDLPVNFRKDEASFREGLKNLGDAAAFAAALGCPRMIEIIPPSSETPKAELRKIYLDRLRACSEVLERSRVRLGLEFISPLHLRKRLPYEFLWRMDEMLEFTKECGSNVGLLLDAWHWHHAGATPKDIIAAGGDRIVYVHVSDAPDLPPEKIVDNQRLLPGEGVIDLVGFFRALKQISYEDGISPEILGRLKGMTPEEGAKLGLQTTREVMRRAGVA
jgi:sugar phosphate isomerase/epimerase